ncbi:MAG: hypothetical protein ACREJ3_00720, partial [Polyangiaceae bacterium]
WFVTSAAGAPGDTAWVQFVLQSNSTATAANFACIWNIDVTVAGATSNAMGYTPKCVNPPKRAGGFQAFDYAAVGGSTFVDNMGNAAIGMVVQFSWVPANQTGLYAVVAPDTFGLGQGTNWSDLSGTVLGQGSGSQAVFSNGDTSVLTTLLAGSCANAPSPVTGIPWPGICPTQPVLLPNTSLLSPPTDVIGQNDVTGETSNMTLDAPNALVSLNDDLVYTEYLSSTAAGGACVASSPHVFVRDTNNDTGSTPSNLGGQPFWESPDILLVPKGAAVNVNSIASETLVTPGQQYDVYIRINNDLGCSAVSGVTAKVSLADPTALSTAWVAVTSGYVGDAASPGGLSVAAASKALLGPLTFTAPASGFGNGHRCLLADIEATGEGAPANETDAPGSYQVAQRNVQFTNCAYPLTNSTMTNGNLTLTLTTTGVAPTGNKVQVTFDDPTAAWFGVWQGGAGYTVSNSAGKTVVTLAQQSVTLAAVTLNAGNSPSAVVNINLVSGDPATTVDLSATLKDSSGNTLVSNGGSCVQPAPPIAVQ